MQTAPWAQEVQRAPWDQDVDEVRPQVLGASTSTGIDARGLRRRPAARQEDEDEEEYEGVQQEPPTMNEKRWGTWLAVTAIVDVVMSGAIFITSFTYAYRDAGVSLWSMGIQAISHLLSSCLLAFRYCGENALPSTDEASAAGLLRRKRRRFLVREQVVSITMGLVMLLSSAALLFKAFRKIRFWNKWYQDQLLREAMDREVQWVTEFLAWYGFAIYFLQAVFRFCAARTIRRSLVWHTFSASVVSMIFLLVLGVAASNMKEWSWKAEPIAAIALAFVTLVEAIRIVVSYLDDIDTRLKYNPRA